jgi:hypothetical protein
MLPVGDNEYMHGYRPVENITKLILNYIHALLIYIRVLALLSSSIVLSSTHCRGHACHLTLVVSDMPVRVMSRAQEIISSMGSYRGANVDGKTKRLLWYQRYITK